MLHFCFLVFFLIYPQRLCFFTLLVIFSLFMFTVVFFVLREIMFHVSTLLPFSNGDSQQVIMYVTVPSRGFPPDTISVTPRLLSCKSVTEENQRTFLFIFLVKFVLRVSFTIYSVSYQFFCTNCRCKERGTLAMILLQLFSK